MGGGGARVDGDWAATLRRRRLGLVGGRVAEPERDMRRRGACGGHREERWGGGDGAGPHVGAVVLPAEQRRGRTMRWSVALMRFLGVEIQSC
jgi:hypothetical protein